MRLTEIHGLPAHLVRRAQQIAVSLFLDECRAFGITSIQFGILSVVGEYREVEQSTLANMLALDQSSISEVVTRLEERGLLARRTGKVDRRTKRLHPTPQGDALVAAMDTAVHRANDRVLAALEPKEQDTFMRLLTKLVDVNNQYSRAPLKLTATE